VSGTHLANEVGVGADEGAELVGGHVAGALDRGQGAHDGLHPLALSAGGLLLLLQAVLLVVELLAPLALALAFALRRLSVVRVVCAVSATSRDGRWGVGGWEAGVR
jgi:hypothetical protein